MHSFVLSPLAELDLEEIWLYSFHQWSAKQANKYQDELYAGIDRICENTDIGNPVGRFFPGYRRYKINHHILFYTANDSEVCVVRVLHEQMDIPERLLDDLH